MTNVISKFYDTKSLAQVLNIATGEVYITNNLLKFSEEFGLVYRNFYNMATGKTKRYGDWILDPNRPKED